MSRLGTLAGFCRCNGLGEEDYTQYQSSLADYATALHLEDAKSVRTWSDLETAETNTTLSKIGSALSSALDKIAGAAPTAYGIYSAERARAAGLPPPPVAQRQAPAPSSGVPGWAIGLGVVVVLGIGAAVVLKR